MPQAFAAHVPPRFLTPLIPVNLPVRRCPVSRDAASKRILILRLGAYGDILMATPLLASLRESYPEAHLTWMAGPTEFQSVDANPYLDELIVWDGAYIRSAWRHGRIGPAVVRALSLWRDLRRRRFDLFISLQPEEWPLLLRASGAAQTIGIFNTFARHWGEERNPHYRKLYTHSYSRPDLHRIDQYLAVLEALGLPPAEPQMTMGFTAEDATTAGRFLSSHGISPLDKVAVLAPLTTWPTKCWPADRYAALADTLASEERCRVVLVGAKSEEETLKQIAMQMASPPAALAAGALSFREAAALIARAKLLVSGDTGPMHVAAAVGTPQVALFGATSPAWYGPRTDKAISLLHEVPCGPCDQKQCSQAGEDYLRCLKGILGEEARVAASRLLRASL